MARHAKTRTFTVEFYRLISPAQAGDGKRGQNEQANATFTYADGVADGPMTTAFSRTPTSADNGNVVVMDTLVIRNDEDTSDPAALAAITIDSITPGTRKRRPAIHMPNTPPYPATVAHQVSYTQPQAVRFIKRTGVVPYSGGPISISALADRAVHVEQVDPAPLDGYRHLDFDDSRWTDTLHTPGTDLHFDTAWAGITGISTACRLTFEV